MQYRCPKCQSVKIMPVGQGGTSARPVIPKSLVILLPAIFILLFLVLMSIGMWIFGSGAGLKLQIATVVVFVVTAGAGLMFWRDLPNFKLSMQAFMQSQKHWKCRECHHEWQI
ncbi:zinc-ribbon domain-containing protein [Acinetobacter guerrae]|uniref:zinc-ribbon domain-containing protein n=1 Tax=Acinetobacter guerrae TaxID=1843371 RepID=UPI00125F55AD|nr:zinc-ribbon domain-containing protein [Acinetobacter guerrae]